MAEKERRTGTNTLCPDCDGAGRRVSRTALVQGDRGGNAIVEESCTRCDCKGWVPWSR